MAQSFGVDNIGKGTIEKLVVAMFGASASKMSDIELFAKVGLKAKSIVLTKKGKRTEDMKLFSLSFDEFHDPSASFENSPIYDYFAEGSILCIVLEEPSASAPLSENVFRGFKRVSFDDEFIDGEVRRTYEDIHRLVSKHELAFIPDIDKKTGKPKVNKTGAVSGAPNFPKSKDHVVFVRGTGRDSTDKTEFVNGIAMYRQQIWIKGSYMAERLLGASWI